MSEPSQKSRFSSCATPTATPPVSSVPDGPTRLLSIMPNRAYSQSPRMRHFEPNPPLPKLGNRKSSVTESPVNKPPCPVSKPSPGTERFPVRRPHIIHGSADGFGGVPTRPLTQKHLEEQKKQQEEMINQNTWLKLADSQYRPITLPFFTDKAENEPQQTPAPAAALVDEMKQPIENHLMFVQLPSALPWKETKQKDIIDKGDDAAALMIQKFFAQSLGSINGTIGKLRVYKSGKIVLRIGDQDFVGLSGIRPDFYQEFASVNEQRIYQFLGPVGEQLVFVPKIG